MHDDSPENPNLKRQSDVESSRMIEATHIRGRERWRFACAPEDVAPLLGAILSLARREHEPFDWFDAAAVIHELARKTLPISDDPINTPVLMTDQSKRSADKQASQHLTARFPKRSPQSQRPDFEDPELR